MLTECQVNGRRQQQERVQQHAARFAPEAGSWTFLFATGDAHELKAYVNELILAEPDLRSDELRIDAPCSRDGSPPHYSLSRFMPHPAPEPCPAPEPDHQPAES
ncbi:hypothetical protein TR51_13860 [Kitasatospora griseola]|uniref:Uncharacterized protein n=1 Tax=Kitasatospora griseola TaxID=2064 RepID=A0A0D0P0P5_KITGR|nr:hypothetical protein [Kitasatospora griseola]KIQ65106.1 hypothetical protein TR51_13860 [Kitasatospora griseola]